MSFSFCQERRYVALEQPERTTALDITTILFIKCMPVKMYIQVRNQLGYL